MSERTRPWAAAGGVGFAVLLVFGRTAWHPTSRVVGSVSVDGFGTQWFFWFAGEVLAGRQQAGWTDLLFFPWGKDLYAHTGGNLIDAWMAWPLREALGPVFGFNAWVGFVLLTNAVAGARLARAFGAAEGVRWLGAIALVLNPYVLAELDLGRPTQAWLAPMGFAVAGLVAMKGARAAAMAGVWLGLTALAYWYYGLLVGVAGVGVGSWRIVAGPARWRELGRQAVAAAVAGAIVLPFALPMRDALSAGGVPGLLALDGTGALAPLALRTVEGDAQGLYVVAPLLAAAGSLLDEGGLHFNPGIPALFHVHLVVGLLGLGALAAGKLARTGEEPGGWATARRGIVRWGWAPLLAVGALLVASGPAIVAGEWTVPNRPWIALVAHSEVLRRWWWPGRAVALAHVAFAPAFALVLGHVVGWKRGVAAAIVLVALVVPLRREALLPLAGWEAEAPPLLGCLADAPAGAVIDVPLLVDQKNLWFQTLHHKPLLGGMLMKKAAFQPVELGALRGVDPLLVALDVIGDHRYTTALEPATDPQRAALLALGYRYVLARVDAFRRPRVDVDGVTTWVSEWGRPRRMFEALLGPPAAEDATFALWTLDRGGFDCPAGATPRP